METNGNQPIATSAATAAATDGGGLERLDRRSVVVLICVGLACGILSGLFGIGGGTIIVPALVWLGLSQRHAAATSLAAIVPTSISGVVSYATGGNVNWIAALLLALGVVVGSQLGSLLLSRLPEVALRWIWVVFLIFVIIQQVTFTPPREGHIVLHVWSGLFLILLGCVTGALAGVLGIGGGAIMMPALSFLFGASDLMARGTSLLVMFPGAISGTVANWKRGIVHLKSGLIVGCCAAVTAPLGTMMAGWLTPRAGSLLFAAWLTFLAVRSTWTALKATRAARGN
ncbi:sulfite exporter TauE/SafE family protein [Bifidobacterium biavatii]|uniref:Probable membrane transporter protein n=1 Tax=Bifidobacterium biavatii DSM 23969 TaxID=1437608 RepID=A0A087A2R5_9BIFI|nr:sulfite exporter TauE/SafE family protein [Bifidobacterium biavatii]KFI53065.1 permease [Bifidobacterium biavatii DSM 23969]